MAPRPTRAALSGCGEAQTRGDKDNGLLDIIARRAYPRKGAIRVAHARGHDWHRVRLFLPRGPGPKLGFSQRLHRSNDQLNDMPRGTSMYDGTVLHSAAFKR